MEQARRHHALDFLLAMTPLERWPITSRVIGHEIRTEATEKGKVNQQALGGAIAMRSANPFRKLFNYSPEALDAFTKGGSCSP